MTHEDFKPYLGEVQSKVQKVCFSSIFLIFCVFVLFSFIGIEKYENHCSVQLQVYLILRPFIGYSQFLYYLKYD